VVAPKDSGLVKNFTTEYRRLCHQVGAPLADSCPAREKAFYPATSGTVLGVWFDSEQLTWSLSRDKIEGIVQEIDSFLVAQVCNLKQI